MPGIRSKNYSPKDKKHSPCLFKPLLIIFQIIFVLFCNPANAEDMTITTYYPSPNGSYDALSVKRLSVGDTNGDGSINSSDVSASSGYLLVSGRLGIGTTAPNAKLTLSNNVYTSPLGSAYSQYQLLLYDSGSAGTAYGMGIESSNIGLNSNGGYKFYQSGGSTPLMVIGGASNTNVGIGTASPGAKLDVNQTAAGIFGIRISRVGGASDANNWYLWNMDGSYGNDFEIWQYPNDSSPSCCIQRLEIQDDGDTVLVPSGGNVGIGTAGPAAKLHVLSTGDVAHEIFDTSSTANKRVRINFAQNGVSNMEIGTDYSLSNTADLYIYNRSTGQTAAYFNPAGNVWFSMAGSVGIGTTSPAQKLHVAGNIRIDSGAVVSGTRSNFFLALQSDRNLVLYDNGSAVWASGTSTSDIRLKKNVKDIGRVLDKLEKIRAVSFNFKDDETNRKEIGVIAQELEKDFPELIYIDPKSGYKLVDYPKLTALLLQAIRDLQSDTDKKISAVSDKLEALSKRVDKMSGK